MPNCSPPAVRKSRCYLNNLRLNSLLKNVEFNWDLNRKQHILTASFCMLLLIESGFRRGFLRPFLRLRSHKDQMK